MKAQGVTACPYEVLELPQTFTYDQLRANYKRLALATHPDRSKGSHLMFKLVQASYDTLLKVLEKRKVDKQFHELRKGFREHAESGSRPAGSVGLAKPVRPVGPVGPDNREGRFDVKKFNAFFEANAFKDAQDKTDDGYGDWMEEPTTRKEITVKNTLGKFNHTRFNKAFDSMAPKSREVSVYHEPAPFGFASSAPLPCTELGVTSVADYSGLNAGKSTLHYMDYMTAHTTTFLADTSAPQRKEYSSVKELDRERASISFQMSENDKRRIEEERLKAEKLERKRLRVLAARDRRIEEHHLKISNRLMA